jgi:PAS domain S-box-containing protein
LAAAVEKVGDSIIVTDKDGVIQYVNSTFLHTTGYTREEVIGKFPYELGGSAGAAHLFPDIVKTLKSGKTWQGMVDSHKKDGSLYYESATISPMFDENGKMIHHVCIRQDLTDRLKLEEEKERLEQQYHQAQKLESIGRLAGGVAHDLNNLLGPILGYAELLLQNTDESDERHSSLDVIHKSGLRARDVVRQLLAFSRKQSLSMKEVDLSTVVEGFQDLLRRTLLENIRIEYRLVGGLTIKADTGQLEQVLLNLAVNAQDAMPEGGILVLETEETLLDAEYIEKHSGATIDPGRYAVLKVSDTGHGIDKATLEKIFEPFFSTKDMGKGTGLGLAMVYGTVKQHNGYIWAYSEKGKGTIFRAYFPLLDASPAPVSPPVIETSETPVKTGAETVMVVEDDTNVRQLTLQILTQKGYQVLSAESGAECLKLLEKRTDPVHILLTDVIMPDMNGKELYSKVEKRLPGVKVIYMSGYTDEVIAHHGVLDPGTHFIQKPFSTRDLAAKVREVLDDVSHGTISPDPP